jgi:hypothetical protein
MEARLEFFSEKRLHLSGQLDVTSITHMLIPVYSYPIYIYYIRLCFITSGNLYKKYSADFIKPDLIAGGCP